MWAFGVVGRDAVDKECVDVADSLGTDTMCRLVGGGSAIGGNVLSRRAVMVLCLAGLIRKCDIAWL